VLPEVYTRHEQGPWAADPYKPMICIIAMYFASRCRRRYSEELGAFELAELWADRMAWPVTDRTAYDELATHVPVGEVAGLLAADHDSRRDARGRAARGGWGARQWRRGGLPTLARVALRQRNLIIGGKLGVTEEAYESVAQRFAAAGIERSS
jgi:hypothetical protein